MKKNNVPIVLFVLFVLLIASIFIISRDNSIKFLIYSGFYFSPISILILLINKIFKRDVKSKYFIPVLIMNLILIIIAVYFYKFSLSNLMNLG